jgi:hypothetical protein
MIAGSWWLSSHCRNALTIALDPILICRRLPRRLNQ